MMPTFTPVSGVFGVSGVFLVIQQMIGGYWLKKVLQQTWQFNANVVCFQLSFACCFAPACMSLLMVT